MTACIHVAEWTSIGSGKLPRNEEIMGWKESDCVSERLEFCRLRAGGSVSMSELCRRFAYRERQAISGLPVGSREGRNRFAIQTELVTWTASPIQHQTTEPAKPNTQLLSRAVAPGISCFDLDRKYLGQLEQVTILG